MEDIHDTTEEDISDHPTLKITPLSDHEPAKAPVSAPSPKAPTPVPARATREADEDSEAAEVMEDEGGLGWVLLLVIIAAAVGVAAYLFFK